mmetsp:Transcript_1115/g.1851  ORF Transcript_1115/g.1851 Transcript_1115/m.1851 type:complete len:93 (-) Transcript_1115:325-603(-)
MLNSMDPEVSFIDLSIGTMVRSSHHDPGRVSSRLESDLCDETGEVVAIEEDGFHDETSQSAMEEIREIRRQPRAIHNRFIGVMITLEPCRWC